MHKRENTSRKDVLFAFIDEMTTDKGRGTFLKNDLIKFLEKAKEMKVSKKARVKILNKKIKELEIAISIDVSNFIYKGIEPEPEKQEN